MSNDGFLVLSFPIPAVQLHTSNAKHIEMSLSTNCTYNWGLSGYAKANSGWYMCVCQPIQVHHININTCIQPAGPAGTSLLRTSLQTVGLSSTCCGRSWWSNGPAAGPYLGTVPAGPGTLEHFHLTLGTGRSHHWTCDLNRTRTDTKGVT